MHRCTHRGQRLQPVDLDVEPTYALQLTHEVTIERFRDEHGVVHEGAHLKDSMISETACERWVEWGPDDRELVAALNAVKVEQTDEPVTCMLCLARMQ